MADFTAKDVQALRQSTGAGMMDAKKALTENGGDPDAAAKWLREKGLAKAASRTDRDNSQGTVAVALEGSVAAIVELKCETDFVAKSDQFTALVQEIATLVAVKGESAATSKTEAIDDLKLTLKENIELGQVVRIEAEPGHVIDSYVHRQDGRGVNGVIVELTGGTRELAHDVAVHVAFTKPIGIRREDIPEAEVAEERATLEGITRAEGKPEAAMEKIVEGRLTGWFKERVLLEQGFVKDEKTTIKALLGDADVARVAQVVVGS
ncbi:translation elongation factor Ts [Iamia sp. SCSIO 61187]|uniref:translation elongation factor Ts n=1 Tax=Iamia sp. SCSIO 61187 TaxID=2722752 RepID=UPI001C62FDDF|nr:translation elongation factor Ts [Iamia sp. SCSIO 61187]QYG92651.1 translation elongation factor Ts [Iamia sp. SCSIO 61187]